MYGSVGWAYWSTALAFEIRRFRGSRCRTLLKRSELWIPPQKCRLPARIPHARSALQQAMRAVWGPLPRRLFVDAPADPLIHRRFDEAGADSFAGAVARTIIGNETLVVLNRRVELLDSLEELPGRVMATVGHRGSKEEREKVLAQYRTRN